MNKLYKVKHKAKNQMKKNSIPDILSTLKFLRMRYSECLFEANLKKYLQQSTKPGMKPTDYDTDHVKSSLL